MGKMFSFAEQEQRERILKMCNLALRSNFLSDNATGIVLAGFGHGELFPTLYSFEFDGMLHDQLKYNEVEFVDIDRAGPKASVVPFAQKEMVERFCMD